MSTASNFICPICSDHKSDVANDYFVMTKCDGKGGHVFHESHIRRWVTQSGKGCPICKKTVVLRDMSRLYECDPKRRVLDIKIAVLGDAGVGKTSLVKRFETGVVDLNVQTTIAYDLYMRHLEVDNHAVNLKIWDPSGTEEFHSIIPSCIRDCDGIIFCYDKLHFKSLSNVCRTWMVFAANHVRQKEFASVLLECMNDKAFCTFPKCRGTSSCRAVTNDEKRTSVALLGTQAFSCSVRKSIQAELEAPFKQIVRNILASKVLREQIFQRNNSDTNVRLEDGSRSTNVTAKSNTSSGRDCLC